MKGGVVSDELRQLAELGQTPVACSMLLKGHSFAIKRLNRQLRASSDIYSNMPERTKVGNHCCQFLNTAIELP
jgi:hypothetical protein